MKKKGSFALCFCLLFLAVRSFAATGYLQGKVPYWDAVYNDGNAQTALDYTLSKVFIDDARETVLKIQKTSPKASNSYGGAGQYISAERLTAGNTYVFRFDMQRAKAQADSAWEVFALLGNGWNNRKDLPNPGGVLESGWVTYTYEAACTSVTNFGIRFYVGGTQNTVLIDNVSIYDKSDSLCENLLSNPDFETDAIAEGFSGLNALYLGDGDCDFVWNPLSETIAEISIADARTGELLQSGDRTQRRFRVSLSQPEQNRDFIITVTDIWGNQKQWMQSVSGLSLEAGVQQPVITQEEEAVLLSTKVKNSHSVRHWIGLYGVVYRDGILCDVRGIRQEAFKTASAAAYEEMAVSFAIPQEAGNYLIKAFVWEGMEGMKPLTATTSYPMIIK